MSTCYLSSRGYTLLKSSLSSQQQEWIRKTLTIRPQTPGAPPSHVSFPAYRESPTKMYVPRYFGEEHFGPVRGSLLPPGDPIRLSFRGQLRERQVPIIAAYLERVGVGVSDGKGTNSGGGGGIIEVPCGEGKTAMAIHLICVLGVKALIVVGKEFLMTQWTERLGEFAPGCRIGRIQGPLVDVADKDVVFTTMQSLSMKDYPTGTFASFGMMVIDEVHHISSETFSRALFKVVPRYTLGLSATVERSDGTSFVFKLFLGSVVYKLTRAPGDGVVVRALMYEPTPPDADFAEVVYDYQGRVASSKMISKLCDYAPRTEFILRVLIDTLRDNPRQQIMVLAQYKNILTYLFRALQHRHADEITVGFYIGGMKDTELKESEGKQVVLATYSMAAEGLDIPSLTTLLMATPMTNIEQAVGRILRRKHAFAPCVLDVVDMHSNFRNQWAKRRRFYKTQQYAIYSLSSEQYTKLPPQSPLNKWTCVYRGGHPHSCNNHDELLENDPDADAHQARPLFV